MKTDPILDIVEQVVPVRCSGAPNHKMGVFMLLGFNLNFWTREVTQAHLPILQSLADSGYDGVEIPIAAGTQVESRSLAGWLDDLGLRRTALTVMPGPNANCISDDAAARSAALDHIKWAIDHTAEMGAELLCGPMHQALFEIPGAPPTPTEILRLVQIHIAAADYAAGCGVRLSVEPLNRFECHCLTTCADASALVAEVNRPNYGFLYDTFHANIEETNPVHALDQNLGAINHVHFSENDRGAPGQGHIPWHDTLTVLKQRAYDGWCVIESFGRMPQSFGPKNRVYRHMCESDEAVYRDSAVFLRNCWADA